MTRKKQTNSRTSKNSTKRNASRRTGSPKRRRQSRAKKTPANQRFLSMRQSIWSRLFTLGLTGCIILLLALAWFAHDLPNVDKLQAFDKSPGIRIYDQHDTYIASYGQVVGEYIPFDAMPPYLVAAVIATEDRRFFDHIGMDFWGLLRAIVANVRAGKIVQGGSTITQQLAKNVFLTSDRTFKRKIQELILSFWLENHFSKQEILEMYLNRVYLGAGNYGIDAASRHYFNRSAREMNLQESALLAGLLKAPSRYAPTRNARLSLDRTRQVLLNMQDAGILKDNATAIAISEMPKTLQFRDQEVGNAQYFTDWIADRVPDYLGRLQGDIIVYTTLDVKLQELATEKLTQIMQDEGKAKNASQAALVTLEPDGAVRALIGGIDYHESQYNRATQALRQPGSAFKLFVYLAAIANGLMPNSWVMDEPVRFGKWSPKNYSHEYLGEITLREAFYRSINTVAAKLANEAGIDKVIEMARRLGITTPMKRDLSLSLGTSEVTLLQLTSAFAHMSVLGQQVVPYAIRKITDHNGNLLYERQPGEKGQVIRPNVARMMNDLLTDTVEQGTGRRARIDRPAAGKTGTSQDFRDGWFIGFTPQLTTGVWVGNDNNSSMDGVTGGSLPAAIWQAYMREAHAGMPKKPIPQMFKYIDPNSGPDDNLPWRKEPTPSRNPLRSIFDWFDNR